MASADEISEKSVTINVNSDTSSQSETTQEADSFSSYSTVLAREREELYPLKRENQVAVVNSLQKDPDTDHDASGGTHKRLASDEEMGAFGYCENSQDLEENICTVSDWAGRDWESNRADGMVCQQVSGIGEEVSPVFATSDERHNSDEDVYTVVVGVEKDLNKAKDLSAVLTGVEKDRSWDKDRCTIFDGVEKDVGQIEYVNKARDNAEPHHIVDKDDIQSPASTAESYDLLILEPPEAFRVRHVYLRVNFLILYDITFLEASSINIAING